MDKAPGKFGLSRSTDLGEGATEDLAPAIAANSASTQAVINLLRH